MRIPVICVVCLFLVNYQLRNRLYFHTLVSYSIQSQGLITYTGSLDNTCVEVDRSLSLSSLIHIYVPIHRQVLGYIIDSVRILSSQLGTYDRLSVALAAPPAYTTVRCNTLKGSTQKILEELRKELARVRQQYILTQAICNRPAILKHIPPWQPRDSPQKMFQL